MVTSAPNERITEANSTPMTPPPSTTTRAGTASSAERLVAGDDRAADLEPGQRAGVGAGGEHDVPADEAPVADDDGAVALEPAGALDVVDLARLHQPLQALVAAGRPRPRGRS